MTTKIFPTVNDVGGGKTITEVNFVTLIKAFLAKNFVVSGFTAPASSADLVLPIDPGEACISGYDVSVDVITNVTCTASATNHIYLKLTRDVSNNVTGATFEVNTTGVAPADSVKIRTAVTGASSITSTADARILSPWDAVAGHKHTGAAGDAPQINADGLAPGAVDTTKILDANVTGIKIADGAVSTTKIVDSAVTSIKILDGNVITAKLADGAVTPVKLSAVAKKTIPLVLYNATAGLSTNSTTPVDIYGSLFSWKTDYAKGRAIYFETLMNTDVGGIVHADLYDVSAAAQIAGSQIDSSYAGLDSLLLSGVVTIPDAHLIKVRFWSQNAAYYVRLWTAKIVVL